MSISNVSNNATSAASLAGYGASTPGNSGTNSVEQLLQDIMNLLQDSSADGTPQASTGTPGTPATGTGTGTGAASMDPQTASGALAGYMGTNGNQSLNMNDLYQLSQGQPAGGKGQPPSPEVQQAAQYMMANPGVYKQIETNDVAGADGKSGQTNFQNAAQGLVPGLAQNTPQSGGMQGMPQTGSTPAPQTAGMPTTPQTASTQGTPQSLTSTPATSTPATGSGSGTGAPSMDPQSASGALAGYMGTNGNQSLDMNAMYQLSQGQPAGGKGQPPSPEVQQAAQYMMANPGVYNKIETNDVAGADGKSGQANFQNASQGLV